MNRLIQLFRNRRVIPRLVELALRFEETQDVWTSVEVDLHAGWFGSPHDFQHYLEGKSAVETGSVAELRAWLLGCEYVRDRELFQEPDYWQHPLTFEQLRRGDCEDHALWAWRKLAELALPASFCVGRWNWNPEEPAFHAWVVFEDRYDKWILEGTHRDPALMQRRFAEAKAEYAPHFSAGHFGEVRAYGGLIQYRDWQRGQRRRERQSGGEADDSADWMWIGRAGGGPNGG
ncbi:MAG TPA: hypothetical protein VFU47_08385 [Armatimonadota bacterium]|nr:hypothetical protein [Armatimonadota bacterium]